MEDITVALELLKLFFIFEKAGPSRTLNFCFSTGMILQYELCLQPVLSPQFLINEFNTICLFTYLKGVTEPWPEEVKFIIT